MGQDRSRIIPAESLGIGSVEHGEMEIGMDPALRIEHELGVDGESGSQDEATLFGDGAQDVQIGPGTLGIDMVGGDRRDTAPIVDPRIEQQAEVVGEIRRSLEMDLGRQDDPGHGDGVEIHIERTGRLGVHGCAFLREEVLDDHLLHMAMTAMRGGDGLEGGDAVLPFLADADQDAGGERDLQLTGPFEGVEAALRMLVGSPAMAGEVVAQRLDHHPLRW